jgi:hypothetical protein
MVILLFWLKSPEVLTKAKIGGFDQAPIERSLRYSGFIASRQQNGATTRIKRKGHPPWAVVSVEAKLFHV